MFISFPMVKLGAQVVAGLGVTKVIADVIKNNVNIVTTADVVKVWTGSLVLGSLMVEQSSNHIERTVNEVTTWYKSLKDEKTEETDTTTEK